jgi:alcohol dehydrogenase (cytochrome c)
MKGYFQYHQNESWDWDAMNAPMLVDFQKGGDIKGLLTPQRNGYLYWLKRGDDGSIGYLDSEAYVPQDVFKSIDPKTGRPDVDLAHKPGTGKAALI